MTGIDEEIDTILVELPECVNKTVYKLAECYIDNAATCNSTCSSADMPASDPFAALSIADIESCGGFQPIA